MDLSHPSDVAFTPSVKSVQERKGSRPPCAAWSSAAAGRAALRPISRNSSRHRPASSSRPSTPTASPISSIAADRPGFLHVLDENTIAFADFAGNGNTYAGEPCRQSPRSTLPDRLRAPPAGEDLGRGAGGRRVTSALIAEAHAAGLSGAAEQVIVLTVTAWDAHCPQHIPQRFEARMWHPPLAERDRRIERWRRDQASRRHRPL